MKVAFKVKLRDFIAITSRVYALMGNTTGN